MSSVPLTGANAGAAAYALPPPASAEREGKAAAAAAVVALSTETDQKLQSQIPKEFEKKVDTLFKCLKIILKFKDDPKEKFGFLNISTIQDLVIFGFIFNIEKVSGQALLVLFQDLRDGKTVETFVKYWRNCRVEEGQIKLYSLLLKDVIEIEKLDFNIYNAPYLRKEKTVEEAKQVFQDLLDFIKKVLITSEPSWKLLKDELVLEHPLYCLRKSDTEFDYSARVGVTNSTLSILTRYPYYFNTFFPKVVREFQMLKKPDCEKIKRLSDMCASHFRNLCDLANRASNDLGIHEYHIFSHTGAPLLSQKAKSIMMHNNCEYVARLTFKKFGLLLQQFVLENPGTYTIAFTETELQKWLGVLTSKLAAAPYDKAAPTKRPPFNGVTYVDTFENFKSQCDYLIQFYVNQLHSIFGKYSKEQHKAKIIAQKTLSHIGTRYKEILKNFYLTPDKDAKLSDALRTVGKGFESGSIFGQPFDSIKNFYITQAELEQETKSVLAKKRKKPQDFKDLMDRVHSLQQTNRSLMGMAVILRNLVNMMSSSLTVLDAAQVAESSTVADAHLQMLMLEEETGAHAAEGDVKSEADDKASTSEDVDEPPLTPVATPKRSPKAASPKAVQVVPFYNATAKFAFQLRNEIANCHGIDAATVFAPALFSQYFGQKQSAKAQAQFLQLSARHQQVYSVDQFALALELLSLCTDPADKKIVINMLLLWGYLSVEQGVDVAYRRAFPNHDPAHDLQRLVHSLKLTGVPETNLWMREASQHSLSHRYAWNFVVQKDKDPTFALRHMREGNATSVGHFEKHLTQWVHDAGQLQAEVLRHEKSSQSVLTKIDALMAEFNKQKDSVAQGDRKNAAEGLSGAAGKDLPKCVAMLETAAGQFQSYLKEMEYEHSLQPSEADQKQARTIGDEYNSLQNALGHLKMVQSAIALFTRFPQQRYMHLIFHLLMSSAKTFTETLWTAVTGHPTHKLETYQKELETTTWLKKDVVETVRMLDVGKGEEHPYRYFGNTPAHAISKAMSMLSELYARSQEAVLLGEGAELDDMKPKSVAELQTEMVVWARQFTDLICTLTTHHFTAS